MVDTKYEEEMFLEAFLDVTQGAFYNYNKCVSYILTYYGNVCTLAKDIEDGVATDEQVAAKTIRFLKYSMKYWEDFRLALCECKEKPSPFWERESSEAMPLEQAKETINRFKSLDAYNCELLREYELACAAVWYHNHG